MKVIGESAAWRRWYSRSQREALMSLCDQIPQPADGPDAGRWAPRWDGEGYERVCAEPVAEARAYDRAVAAEVVYAPGSLAERLHREIAALVLERDEARAREQTAMARLAHRTAMLRPFMGDAAVDELERADEQWFGRIGDTVPMPRVRSMPAPSMAMHAADDTLLIRPLPGKDGAR